MAQESYRVLLIGSGNIATFHASALTSIGHKITGVVYNSNLERASKLAKDFNVLDLYSSIDEALESSNYDVLWVIPAWNLIDKLLDKVLCIKCPVFLEKPAALSTERLINIYKNDLLNIEKVQVGYNRRFYEIVSRIKNDIQKTSISFVEINIPESTSKANDELIKYKMLQNSSHLIDLVYYLLGTSKISINYKYNFANNTTNGKKGYLGILQSEEGVPIFLNSLYDVPLNFSLKFYTADNRILELLPIERYRILSGFEILEPTIDKPLRVYNPKIISEYYEPNIPKFKPGFLEQTKHFFDNTIHGKSNQQTPTLKSIFDMTLLIENITGINNN